MSEALPPLGDLHPDCLTVSSDVERGGKETEFRRREGVKPFSVLTTAETLSLTQDKYNGNKQRLSFLPNPFDKPMQLIVKYSYFKVISSLQKSTYSATYTLIKLLT